MNLRSRPQYDDDYFADTRMSFGEHIEDLRKYLVRAIWALVIGTIAGFFISKPVFAFIKKPVTDAMVRFYKEREEQVLKETREDPNHPLNKRIQIEATISAKSLYDQLKQLFPNLNAPPPGQDAPPVSLPLTLDNPMQLASGIKDPLEYMGRRIDLNAMSATETFVVYLMISIVVGLVISCPIIFWQIWSFVAAGLYPHEKKFVYRLLPMSIFFFVAGVLVCEFIVMPAALDALLSFNKWLNVEPDFRLREWLSFAIWMPVITGICFQTPLVMMFIGAVGIWGSKEFMKHWRISVFAMLLFAAIVSPSIDPLSLIWIWVPMCSLYFVGIYLVKRIERKREERVDDSTEEVPYTPELASKP